MANEFSEKTAETNNVKCKDCGANLKYLPGTPYLNCEYCGAKNEIEQVTQVEIIENDYESFLNDQAHAEDKQEISTVKCDNCAASTTLPPNVTGSTCPYCDTPLVIKNATTSTIISPSYLLPFKIDRKNATNEFTKWVGSLWFAPSKLKDYAAHSAEKLMVFICLIGLTIPILPVIIRVCKAYIITQPKRILIAKEEPKLVKYNVHDGFRQVELYIMCLMIF